MIVERAFALLDPAAIAVKLRHAPDWVRRGESRPPRPKYAGVLCGVAAPGVSVPCRCTLDNRELPETINADAWPEALAAISSEKPVRLESRHFGGQLATTADGSLRLSCHPLLGLIVEADMPDEPLARMLIGNASRSGVGLSVAFSHPKIEHRQTGGQTVRVIHRLRLDHVALIAPGQRPAYPGAVAYVAQHNDERAIESARSNARTSAWRHVREWQQKSGSSTRARA